MRDDLIIRKAGPADAVATELVHDEAFGVPEGRRESLERGLVRRLRAAGDVIGELTFVAELEGEVVGHVLCSRAALVDAPVVVLGPMAVRPVLQQQGIGAALLMAVVASADRVGEPVIVLDGDPEYFGFFGFVPLSRLGIRVLQGWSGEARTQALTLRSWRPEMAGELRRSAAFTAVD